MPVTVITDEVREVEGDVVDGRVLVDEPALADAIGWQLKPEGLCRDDRCVPVRDRTGLEVGEYEDATATGHLPTVEAEIDDVSGDTVPVTSEMGISFFVIGHEITS